MEGGRLAVTVSLLRYASTVEEISFPASLLVQWRLRPRVQRGLAASNAALSSSGLGHQVLILVTWVRVPIGSHEDQIDHGLILFDFSILRRCSVSILSQIEVLT